MIRAALAAGLMLATPAHAADEVFLRDRREPVSGEIIAHTPQALTIRPPAEGEAPPPARTIAWTDVRAVLREEGDPAPFAAAMKAGADIRRAHDRLARGDVTGARPLLEAHRDAYLGLPGPVSALLAEGLLACDLWTGDAPRASAAWIAAAAAESPPPARPAWMNADEATGLIPELPPMFAGAEAARAFLEAAAPLADRLPPGSRAGAILAIYADAGRLESAPATDRATLTERYADLRLELVRAHGRDESMMLLADLVGAVAADAETRSEARERLRAFRGAPWAETWAAIAIGRSFARETDADARRVGIVESLDAALHADAPALAALAWHDAARAAREIGDPDAAAAFEGELNARFPGHPAARALSERPIAKEGPNP